MIILGTNSVKGGFNVANSCRFNNDSSDYLNFTPSSNGSRRIFTISFWFKTTTVAGGSNYIFSTGNYAGGDGFLQILLSSSGRLTVEDYDQSGDSYNLRWGTSSTYLYRDPAAWYHFVLAVDSTQGTQSNRAKIYINGVNVSSDFTQTTSPAQNDDFHVNTSSQIQQIGRSQNNDGYYDGYLAEFVMIDGSALAPTSFGEFDEDSGIWKPKNVSGLTFGTNGFYLEFKQSGTSQNSSGIGADTSGNDHHFAVNNLTAVDQSTDTCTNNFCTLNPLTKRAGGTIAEGNLQYTASTDDSSIFGTMAIPPGMKVYFEVKLVSNTAQNAIGIHNVYDPGGTFVKGGSASGMYSFKPRGSASVTQYFNNGSSTDTGTSNYANDTIIGVAVDNANGQIHYHAAGTYINSSDPTDNDPVALVTGFGGASEQYLHFSLDSTGTQPSNQFNFGSPPYSESGGNSDGNGYGNFAHAVPSGYYSLCTKNLAEYG